MQFRMGDIGSKLLDAVERENKQLIEQVLSQYKGKKVDLLNAPFDKTTEMTPLLRAVWRGNEELTKWMLDQGADVNVRGKLMLIAVRDGNTALIWAAIRGREKIVSLLLSRGADIYLCDKHGFTALDHAVINGNYKEALVLHKAGLRPKSLDFYELKKDIFVCYKVNVKEFIEKLEADVPKLENVFEKKPPSNI